METCNFDEEDSVDSLEVELNAESDSEESLKNFEKINGFGGLESGSQSYMSGLLGFEDVENNDYDQNTEDDLKFLGV